METWKRLSLALLAGALAAGASSVHAAKITEYPVPTSDSRPSAIAVGPDGRLWFGEILGKKLGAITTDGALNEYPVSNQVRGLAPIPGRAMAFIETVADGIGFATMTGGVTEFPGYSQPENVVFGPDGRFWITQTAAFQLVAFHWLANAPPTQAYTLSSLSFSIALGPDGRIWATEPEVSKIAACPPGGSTCTEYPVPNAPQIITAGPDGNLWFTEFAVDKIGRITPDGVVTEFTSPEPLAATGICTGPDGNLWLAGYGVSKIARMTTAGVLTTYALPTSDAHPYGIVAGPDGNIWFTERTGNKIGKLRVFTAGDSNGDGTLDVSDVFYLINFLFAGGPTPL